MKIGLFGSCLSSDPAWHLVNHYNAKECFRIFHNRSDQFVKLYINKESYPGSLHEFIKAETAEEWQASATDMLFNQHPLTIGFEGTLKDKASGNELTLERRIWDCNPDLVLIDNFMDIVARLCQVRSSGEGPLFYPTHFARDIDLFDSEVWLDDHLSPTQSADCFLEIVRYFRALCPNAMIHFTCWPSATSRKNKERWRRIADFHRLFSQCSEGEGITIIPPLDIPDELTKGDDDWYHVDPRIYQSIAGMAFYQHAARIGIKPIRYRTSSYLPFDLHGPKKLDIG